MHCKNFWYVLFAYLSLPLPVSVNKWMEDGQISLNRDGDSHKDAGAEEDVVERIEKVGEEEMVEKYSLARHWARVGSVLLKGGSGALCYTQNQEEQVTDCQGYQEIVEITLETLLWENANGQNIGDDAKHSQHNVPIAGNHQRHCPVQLKILLCGLGAAVRVTPISKIHLVFTVIIVRSVIRVLIIVTPLHVYDYWANIKLRVQYIFWSKHVSPGQSRSHEWLSALDRLRTHELLLFVSYLIRSVISQSSLKTQTQPFWSIKFCLSKQ